MVPILIDWSQEPYWWWNKFNISPIRISSEKSPSLLCLGPFFILCNLRYRSRRAFQHWFIWSCTKVGIFITSNSVQQCKTDSVYPKSVSGFSQAFLWRWLPSDQMPSPPWGSSWFLFLIYSPPLLIFIPTPPLFPSCIYHNVMILFVKASYVFRCGLKAPRW